MQDQIELHRLAGEEFAARVDRIDKTQWARRTPCEEWNVRQLVEHVVGFNFLVPWLLDGHTVGPGAGERRRAPSSSRERWREPSTIRSVTFPVGSSSCSGPSTS